MVAKYSTDKLCPGLLEDSSPHLACAATAALARPQANPAHLAATSTAWPTVTDRLPTYSDLQGKPCPLCLECRHVPP